MNETERNDLAKIAAEVPKLTAARDKAREALREALDGTAKCGKCGHKNEPKGERRAFTEAASLLAGAEQAKRRLRNECVAPELLQAEDAAGVRLRAAEHDVAKFERELLRAQHNMRVLKNEGGERAVRDEAAADLRACEEELSAARLELREAEAAAKKIAERVDAAHAKALTVK